MRFLKFVLKLLAIVLIIVLIDKSCDGQTIGGNAEGLTDKYQASDLFYFDRVSETVIAWPGGASAKYCEARLDRKGIGMQRTTINRYNTTYAKNENRPNDLSVDLKDLKLDSTDDRSQLYDLKEVQDAGNFKILWKVNVFVSPEVVIKSIQDFISIGGSISGLVLGNELYYILDFDGNAYVDLVDDMAFALHVAFPNIPIAMNYAQDVTTKPHMLFNQPVVKFILTNPGVIEAVDTHPYMAAELASAKAKHPANGDAKKEVKPFAYSTTFNPALSSAFDEYNYLWQTTHYYDQCFDTINKQLPGIEIWTSELGTIPVALWGNSWSNSAYLFYIYTEYFTRVKYMCAHNLLGGYLWAFIYDHMIHTMFYSLELANELIKHPFTDLQITNTINGAGDYYYRYINTTAIASNYNFSLPAGLQIDSLERKSVWANTNYATMGAAGYYLKTPAPGNDVYFEVTDNTSLHKYDWGYVHVIVKKTTDTIINCDWDTTYTVYDTAHSTIYHDSLSIKKTAYTVPCSKPDRCSGWLYRLFHSSCRCTDITKYKSDTTHIHVPEEVIIVSHHQVTDHRCDTIIVSHGRSSGFIENDGPFNWYHQKLMQLDLAGLTNDQQLTHPYIRPGENI